MSLPPQLSLFLRVLGVFFAVSLVISPWIVTVESNDPFLSQSWILFGQSGAALLIMAFMALFWTSRRGHQPLLPALAFFWICLALNALQTEYLKGVWWCLFAGALIIHLLFFRLALKPRDGLILARLIILSGVLMGALGVLQSYGLDVLVWDGHRVTGTLSNPNFLAAYLMGTVLLSLGFLLFIPSGLLFSGMLVMGMLVQVWALVVAGVLSAWLGLIAGSFLYAISFWERPGRKISRFSPFLWGAALTGVVLALFGGAAWTVRQFPWEGLALPPYGLFSLTTRLWLFQMGFALFAKNPWFGQGLGAGDYLLTDLRPRLGAALGLSVRNNDPHSVFVQLLSEAGLPVLYGFCVLLAAFWGIHAWRARRLAAAGPAPEEPREENGEERPMVPPPPRVVAVPLLVMLWHGSFNNTFSTVPLVIFIVLLGSIHQALCLPEMRWKRRFSLFLLPYLAVPVIWLILCWGNQGLRQFEEKGVFRGNHLLEANDFFSAAGIFEGVVRRNPQSINGLWGLAAAYEGMGREDKAEETLNLLDVLAPKVLKLRYHLARLLLEQGNILDAHRWALRNLEGDRSPSSHELLGVIHLREGRLGEAEEQFKYSLHLVPTWIKLEAEAASRSRLHLARMAFERGDIKTMGQHLWLVSAPDIRIIPDYSFLSGVFEYRSGHATSAVGLLEKALTALPENTQYANALGFVLVETELDIERGKSILEGAYRRLKTLSAPPPALILDTAHSLGIAYWKSGDVARAKELLFLAYQQTPAEMEALKTSRKADLDRLASPATATPEAPK